MKTIRRTFGGLSAGMFFLAGCRGLPSDPPLLRAEPSGWKVIGIGDVDRDGANDVLWSNESAQSAAIWLLLGTHVLAKSPVFQGPPGRSWRTTTVGDFNGDGMNDVLWFDPDEARFAVWLMDGIHVLARGPQLPAPSADWFPAIAADYNNDNLADIAWFNAKTNESLIYLMDGTHVLTHGPRIPGPVGEGWSMVTNGDFNRDGMNDILLGNGEKHTANVLLMRGTQLLSRGPVFRGPQGEGWGPTWAADFNGDGLFDVLWGSSQSGRMAVSLMRGALPTALGPEIPGPGGAGWIPAVAADTNIDNLADVVWNNPDTNQMAVGLMNGVHPLASGHVVEGPYELDPSQLDGGVGAQTSSSSAQSSSSGVQSSSSGAQTSSSGSQPRGP